MKPLINKGKLIFKWLRNNTSLFQLIWQEYRRLVLQRRSEHMSDYTFICNTYAKECNKKLNLIEPKGYTEKLQWLKLFYRNNLIPICSDKYEVRKYLQDMGQGNLLNDLISVHETVDDIDIKKLPNSFVIKASHGSGWNLIVKDKNKVNWFIWKRIMKSWLKQNLYWYGREWNYKYQTPRLIIEKYLEDEYGELRDYKFFCFGGVPQLMFVATERGKDTKFDFYDMDFNHLPIYNIHPNSDQPIKKPALFDEMKSLAATLSQDFNNVRVDFYEVSGKIYFGEFTFFHGCGFSDFRPQEWELHLGKLINLPSPNHNLDLFEKITKKC